MDQKKHKTISQKSVGVIMGALVVLLLVLAMAFSPLFVLRNIAITGNQFVSDEDICRIGGVTLGDNLFQLQTDEIREHLMKDLRIEQVVVKRSFPSALEIQVTERIPIAVVACDYGYLDIGKDGTVLDAHRTLREMLVPIVTGVTLSDLFVGDCVEDENIKLVLLYLDMLDSESRQQLSEISIANPDQVVAYATNSVQLRIGKLDNLDKKTEISRSFLSELKVAKRPIEYIDLQYESPFIKFKDI